MSQQQQLQKFHPHFAFQRTSTPGKWMRYPEEVIWQPDGDLIVLAIERAYAFAGGEYEGKGAPTMAAEDQVVAFKVSSRLFERASPVMASLLNQVGSSGASGLKAGALVDGYKIIRVNDHATEMAFFLRALYEEEPLSISFLSQSVRLI